MMYEVDLTAPQYELSNKTIAMYWYPIQFIEAKNKSEARKIVEKMIENEEIDYDLMDENGDTLTNSEKKEADDWYDYFMLQEPVLILPQTDWVKKI